jgi:hypothetical protein
MSEQLYKELESEASELFNAGRSNNYIDIGLTCAIVISSVVASGLAAAQLPPDLKWMTVITAALPAALTSIQSKQRVRELSTWYFRKSTALRGLAMTLKHNPAAKAEDIVTRRVAVDEQFENLWFELKTRTEVVDAPKETAKTK